MKLKIKVVPGASRSEIAGWMGESLKIRIAAPPEKGKANAAVTALLCITLNLAAGAVRVVTGSRSQQKVIAIDGMSRAEVLQRLADAGAPKTSSNEM